MPIPPPVKAVLRKDLLLGGGAGALLCALVAGAALSVGSLFGFDWGSGDQPAPAAGPALRLPAIPDIPPPGAQTPRITGPRVVSQRTQPVTGAARRAGAATPAVAVTPTVRGQQPQLTTTPAPTAPAARAPPRGGGTPARPRPAAAADDAPGSARSGRHAPAGRAERQPDRPRRAYARVRRACRGRAGRCDARRRDPGDPDARPGRP